MEEFCIFEYTMKEDFLHHIWKFKRWNAAVLKTIDGEEITIDRVGEHNYDAGPDFFNAQLKIGENKWAGNVEIHINSSDWIAHKHQLDKNYDNVILHVVYQHNKIIVDKNGVPIPTLELSKIIDTKLVSQYQNLIASETWMACEKQIHNVPEFIITSWMDRLAIERLERKAEEIKITLTQNKNDWETTFYTYLLKYLGLKVNALPFQMLAQITPLIIAEKHKNQLSIEALYFGQSGFLEEHIDDEYFLSLKKEYQFLKSKFKLTPLDKSLWKYLRLRPPNFPTIRIAQLSNLLLKNSRLFAAVLAANSIKELEQLFDVKASVYWETHYQFGEKAKNETSKNLGKLTVHNVIINVVVPIMFVYAQQNNNATINQKALSYLEALPSENNTIIKKWKLLNVTAKNALQSQSLLELKNNYCSQKKCLTCSIGNNLLK